MITTVYTHSLHSGMHTIKCCLLGGWGREQVERHLGEGVALYNLLALLDETSIYKRIFPTQRPKLNSITLYFRTGGCRRWHTGPCHINIHNSSACPRLGGFAIFQVVIDYVDHEMVLPLQFSSRFKVKSVLHN